MNDFEAPVMTPNENNKSAWLLTFADLLSLILTFFVLLYSMSSLKEEAWREVSQSLSQRLNPDFIIVKEPSTRTAEKGVERIEEQQAINLDYLEAVLKDKMKNKEELKGVTLLRNDDRIILSLASDLFFESGSAVLQPQVMPAISALINMLSSVTNRIETIGHTDPTPVSGEQYPSNWELSLYRSVVIAQALQNGGYPAPIRAFGLSSSHFDELPSDIHLHQRYNLARRVDIVIRAYRPSD